MPNVIKLSPQKMQTLHEGIHSTEVISGYTHNFYRYPARFSPQFCRSVIVSFTNVGDTVLDPFMGGGTTLVEAMILGRKAYGTDISSLSSFIAKVKTRPLSDRSIRSLEQWAHGLTHALNINNPCTLDAFIPIDYTMNIETNDLWRIRKTIGLALQYILCLPQGPQRNFARCALLKTSQWALDCKTKVVTVGEFRSKLNEDFHSMLKGVVEFTHEVQDQQRRFKAVPRTACLNNSASKLKIQHLDNNIPKLILTSPPYPGVHVLYHRWQINGRRETPIPFGIANCLDSKGAAHYTFGDRKSISSYFSHLKKNFTNLGRLVNNDTIIVQMVSFSKPNEHLMPYLDCMNAVGFEELFLPDLANSSDGRIRREVPNRKWYAENKGKISSSKEIVLFHKPK